MNKTNIFVLAVLFGIQSLTAVQIASLQEPAPPTTSDRTAYPNMFPLLSVTDGVQTEQVTPVGEEMAVEALKPGEEQFLEMKDLWQRTIEVGDREIEIFEDKDMNGDTYYYLKLMYKKGPEGQFWGGFLSDESGNLINIDGEVLTTVEALGDYMRDGIVDELDSDRQLSGIMIMKIVDNEEIPSPVDELLFGMGACQTCSGKIDSIFRTGFPFNNGCNSQCQCSSQSCNTCYNPCNSCNSCNNGWKPQCLPTKVIHKNTCEIDGCVTRQVPKAVPCPVYYDKPVPVPVYKKKCIPYEVIKKEPVYIKKCVPCHIPVKVPVKVPVDVCVPCYKPYTTVVPVQKNVINYVPKTIYQTKKVIEKCPKVVHVRCPVKVKKTIKVPTPYTVVQKVPCVNKIEVPVIKYTQGNCCNQCNSCNQCYNSCNSCFNQCNRC